MTNVYKLYMLCIICAVLIFFFAAFIRFMLNSASKITGQNKISRSLKGSGLSKDKHGNGFIFLELSNQVQRF